jgi:transcriptional regulator with PAS, ATPase and Fis domain
VEFLFCEVGEIEPDVQVKLLRFLQEGEFERVGGNRVIQVKVRVLAATNRNLHQAIRDGKFRDDFFYRLNVIPAIMPPLRERREEIPNLVSLFLERYCRRFGRNAVGISDPAMKALCNYHWPGNVRELEHLIERLVATNQTEVIGIQDVPMDYLVGSMNVIGHNVSRTNGVENNSVLDDKSGYYKRATSLFEKNLIRRVLQKTGGNRRKTAKELGIPLSTLKFRMQKLEMYVE